MDFTLVTGNKNKLKEWQRLLPKSYAIDSIDIDIEEIQSSNPEEIITEKVKKAYKIANKPVVVEDVFAGLDSLNGLPGPFIKFFLKELGQDALYKLAKKDKEPATVGCSAAYYDGKNLIVATGTVSGIVVPPAGENGFGFDKTFVPDNHSKTFAEMSDAEKDKLSHRAKAVDLLIKKL